MMEHYLARDPSPEDRVEVAVARMTAHFVNAHQPQGAQPKTTADFLPYQKAWSEVISDAEYMQTMVDLEE